MTLEIKIKFFICLINSYTRKIEIRTKINVSAIICCSIYLPLYKIENENVNLASEHIASLAY